jgi:hypothetical protein
VRRYHRAKTADVLDVMRYARRRRTNPFAVMDALREALIRQVPPPALGSAVLTFDANLAGEARDAVESSPFPVARFLQATVPSDADASRLEAAWQASAHTLTQLVRVEKRLSKPALAKLRALSVDEVVVEGAQVALAAALPREVEANRWFFPLVILDGSEASVDALLPHVDAAFSGSSVLEALKPLIHLRTSKRPAMAFLLERLEVFASSA